MYYESHITIEPIFDSLLENVTELAKDYGFKMAKLLMQKSINDTPEISKKDTFMTAHEKATPEGLYDIEKRTKQLVEKLQSCNIIVYRYKIEHVIIDIRT